MKPKTISVDENGFVNIQQFSDLLDVSKVEYYQVVANVSDKSMTITFYDKDKNLIKPNLPLDENKENSENK